MRNCFVPHCDAYCKQNGIAKRMMFSAPKDHFVSWSTILFNKREFRETDRVCERHFDRSQILTHWEHIIAGKVCQLEREKPKIKCDAIPYLNLPEVKIVSSTAKKRAAKSTSESKKRKQNANSAHTGKASKKTVKMDMDSDNEVLNTFEFESNEIHAENKPKNSIKSIKNGAVKSKAAKLSAAQKRQIFDTIFDDVYEVVLPSMSWGIHRDEDRQWIMFSLVDANEMKQSILVKITDKFDLTVQTNDQRSNDTLNELTVDSLSKLLNHLNENPRPELAKKSI